MVFKLPDRPSPRADVHELADFVELKCWFDGRVSGREVVAYLSRLDDNDFNEGCRDNEDINAETLDEVMNEIDRRRQACLTDYPFQLERQGTALHFPTTHEQPDRSLVYLFLLLCTRLNMSKHRKHKNLDGADLFEEVASHVLRHYLGGPTRARSFVFGTSNHQSFEERVSHLCKELGEGAGFRCLDNHHSAKDDKLDVVSWIPFTDRHPGQLILFAQCKTGTSWHNQETQLQPDDFVKRWMVNPILVPPVRAYCVSEAANRATWHNTVISTGILFDRCRLVDYCENLPGNLGHKIRTWTEAAKSFAIQLLSDAF